MMEMFTEEIDEIESGSMPSTNITDDEDFNRILPDKMNRSFNKDNVSQGNDKDLPQPTETFTGTRT